MTETKQIVSCEIIPSVLATILAPRTTTKAQYKKLRHYARTVTRHMNKTISPFIPTDTDIMRARNPILDILQGMSR